MCVPACSADAGTTRVSAGATPAPSAMPVSRTGCALLNRTCMYSRLLSLTFQVLLSPGLIAISQDLLAVQARGPVRGPVCGTDLPRVPQSGAASALSKAHAAEESFRVLQERMRSSSLQHLKHIPSHMPRAVWATPGEACLEE